MGNQVFDFVEPEADCHWENTLCDDENKTKISISIDDKVSGGHYHEEFFEHYYEYDEILSMLKNAGLCVLQVLDGETYENITDTSERYLFVTRREK